MPFDSKTLRYSETELAEFKAIIEKKLEKCNRQIVQLEEQKEDLASSLNDNGFDTDDNFAYKDVEFLQSLIYRQTKHRNDLENALIRIKNKSYGVCIVSGQLIDKRRLMAVPTTTKSLESKLAPPPPKYKEDNEDRSAPARKPSKPNIISKIIRKPQNAVKSPVDQEADNFLDGFDLESSSKQETDDNFDLENIADDHYGED